MTYLPDVNVWIALAAERHILHRAARQWFSNLQDEKLAFSRLTQMGFLRLLTNKHVMQDEVMKPDEAWDAYRVLRLDRRIGYLAEPSELPRNVAGIHRGPVEFAEPVDRRVPLRIRPRRSIDLGNVRREDPKKGGCELPSAERNFLTWSTTVGPFTVPHSPASCRFGH
jgi:hypothetical protein